MTMLTNNKYIILHKIKSKYQKKESRLVIFFKERWRHSCINSMPVLKKILNIFMSKAIVEDLTYFG